MSDELELKYRGAQEDLRKFTNGPPSLPDLAECIQLSGLVLPHLDVQSEVSNSIRAKILDVLLPRFVDYIRESALRRLEEDGVPRGEDPVFRAAAATELLKIRTPRFDEQYGRLKKELRRSSLGVRPTGNSGTLAAAGAWIGITKNAVRPEKKKEILYLAFVKELEAYLLLDSQTQYYLQDLVDRQTPPAVAASPVVQAGAHRGAEAAVVPNFGARSVPAAVRELLGRLSSHVRQQLEYEQKENRFADPLPIRLRWSKLEGAGLVDDPGVVAYYFGATGAANGPEVPETLEGIAALFHQQPSGRLVVLGDEGSGKSTLVTELALELLKMRGPGDPVPIIFRLASWDRELAFEDWLIEELNSNNDFLKVKDREEKKTLSMRLVEGGHILAILDGFDEIPEILRQEVIARLNATLLRSDKVVITSRSVEYAQAVSAESGQVLTGAAAVNLRELSLDDVDLYLRGRSTTMASGNGGMPTPWDPVVSALRVRHRSPHAEMLMRLFETPLMAMLAKVAYSKTDPRELLDAAKFASASHVEERLLSAFVEARMAVVPRGGSAKHFSWKPDEAKYWLGFLATLLVAEKTSALAWWRIGSRAVFPLIVSLTWLALVIGIPAMAGAIFLRIPWMYGLSLGPLIIALVAMFSVAGIEADPVHLDWKQVGPMLRAEFLEDANYLLSFMFKLEGRFYFLLLLVGFMASMGFVYSVSEVAAAIFFFVGLPLAGYVSFAVTPYSETEVATPYRLFRLDRTAGRRRAQAYFIAFVVPVGLALSFTGDLNYLVALVALVSIALLIANGTASGAFLVVNFALNLFGLLPKRAMLFLRHAHKRGVLRQVGGVYQFRHELLRDSLAYWFVHENTRHPRIISGIVSRAAENLSPVSMEDGRSGGNV